MPEVQELKHASLYHEVLSCYIIEGTTTENICYYITLLKTLFIIE